MYFLLTCNQVESQYNTPSTAQDVCQFNLTVTTVERVRRFLDQPILVVPKPTKAPNKKKSSVRRKKKCSRRKGKRRCRRIKCKGRRCKNRKGGGGRSKPKPTTPALPVSTRPLPNDGPAPNSVSIKICTR